MISLEVKVLDDLVLQKVLEKMPFELVFWFSLSWVVGALKELAVCADRLPSLNHAQYLVSGNYL